MMDTLPHFYSIRKLAAGMFGCLMTVLLFSPLVLAQDWKPLFNGKSLDGWVYVNTPPDTWSIQDNMLICSGKPIGEIRTDRMYQNFVLELEWRHMVPGGNAGIFVWADDITSRGVPFHRGIEVQVLENDYGNSDSHTTHGDIFPIHGATMNPINGRGGSRAFPTENRSKPSPEWNHYRITCQDGAISLEVNGALVTQGKECNPRKGTSALNPKVESSTTRTFGSKNFPIAMSTQKWLLWPIAAFVASIPAWIIAGGSLRMRRSSIGRRKIGFFDTTAMPRLPPPSNPRRSFKTLDM